MLPATIMRAGKLILEHDLLLQLLTFLAENCNCTGKIQFTWEEISE